MPIFSYWITLAIQLKKQKTIDFDKKIVTKNKKLKFSKKQQQN